ncbi:jerky protein homolog-like [Belonocnema kinseyi]|uniref:jerky protein homolog-like n=1 Tax=Belonocnema kinseyi TaxID=2817044 RepID=UPI00143DD046|nr:jerky protein homolog-like [Belonocnema kinseyi]XP_033217528.1 jerky protein homolog-like [Belonocnema kinseyi]
MCVLKEAWNSVTPSTLRNSWKKLIPALITSAVETLSNNNLVDLLNRVPGGDVCSALDAENWLEEGADFPVFKIMSDKQLLNTHGGLQLPIPEEQETKDSINSEKSEDLDKTTCESQRPETILNAPQSIFDWSRHRMEFTEEELLKFTKARDLALNLLSMPN